MIGHGNGTAAYVKLHHRLPPPKPKPFAVVVLTRSFAILKGITDSRTVLKPVADNPIGDLARLDLSRVITGASSVANYPMNIGTTGYELTGGI